MIQVVILGSREMRYRTGCCGSRSMEEVVLGYISNLYRRFGQKRLQCRYVDTADPEARCYPTILQMVQRNEISLPAVLLNGELILHGRNSLYQLPEIIEQALQENTDQPKTDPQNKT